MTNFKLIDIKMKKIFAIFSLIFGLSFLTATVAFASGPQFNILNGDYKTLRGANFTKAEATWHDPVSGDIEDVIDWTVYIHNGKEGTVAKNVTVSVKLPDFADKNLELSSIVSADNAQSISDKAILNLPKDGFLEYQKGSTVLYDKNGKEIKSLPDGIVSGGINIGDQKGCWPYAVFVVFKTQVKAQELPAPIAKGQVLGAKTLPITGSPITVSLALAFFGTSVYYLIQEEKLLKTAFIGVRSI